MGRFCHVSLLIDLDQEWWLPTAQALRDPQAYFPRRSRVYFHETIHFWHQLCHGYLLALAEEDWRQLRGWEQGGESSPSPFRDAFTRPSGRHGFSASDLCECLARFWEIISIGPAATLNDAVEAERMRSIEEAIPGELNRASKAPLSTQSLEVAIAATGSYSLPYLVARRTIDASHSQVLFPLLGHFALQTENPVESFERFTTDIGLRAAAHLEASGAKGSIWEHPEAIVSLYRFMREACGTLRTSHDVLENSALWDNPAYKACFDALVKVDPTTLDMAVAMPGGPRHREFLIRHASPPCVRFRDRTLATRVITSLDPEASRAAEDLAAACVAVQDRWESFQRSMSPT